MNASLLMQMLASRGAGGNAGMSEILSQLQAGASGNLAATREELLARLSERNPLAAMMFRQLCEPRAPASDPMVIDCAPIEPEHAQLPAPEPMTAELLSELAELRERNQSLVAELKRCRERLDLFAAALGACGLCWGQDEECRACRGRGMPGYAVPDEPLFDEFILPAVRLQRGRYARPGHVAPLAPVTKAESRTGSESLQQTHERGHSYGV